MAKRQYESKIALAARNFVDVKEQSNEEAETTAPVVTAIKEKPVEKKPVAKEQKEVQEKTPAPVKQEENKVPVSSKPETEDDLVAEKANALIQSLIDSGKIQLKKSGKSGRPRKYEDETVLSSFRLTKTNYDYAYKMGRTEYASMTEYINHLIDADINK